MKQGKKLELSVEGFITDTKKFLEEMRALKDENETLSSALHDAQHEIRILKNKLASQKQTLEFYADETIYDPQYKLEIISDGGERARKELIGS